MSTSPANVETPEIIVPAPPRRGWPWPILALVLLIVPASLWAVGWRPPGLGATTRGSLEMVAVDRGDVPIYVVESGSLESADNETVRCRVEALIGTVGGPQGMGGGMGGRSGGMGGRSGGGGTGQSPAAAAPQPAPQPATKAGRGGAAAKGAGAAKAAGGAAGKGATGKSAGGGAAAGAGGDPMGAQAQGGVGVQKPNVGSFTYVVTPHTPLRPQTKAQPKNQNQNMQMSMMGGGGGRGGDQGTERIGSTRILSIKPEGTWVEANEVVCELDSAAFRDELQQQIIRYDQAKAWVDQAEAILEVSQIAVEEYKHGTLPQDRLLIDGYIASCENQREQAVLNLEQSRELRRTGLKSDEQLRADELYLQRTEIVLREARGMRERLDKYTAPRIIKNLEAKVEAVRADLLSQKATFHLEATRKEKLEKMIEYCSVRAPRAGIVVYAKPANAWGRVEDIIQEGVTVREGQPLFQLPDPKRMRVKARINESKVALIQSGARASVRIDAFPDRVLSATVAEVTPIPSAAMGPISDVKVYQAMVDIDSGGFEGLRPGLSAEVSFALETRRDVVRVPIKAVRWFDGEAFVALGNSGSPAWRRIELGQINPTHAEVLSGVSPGDRVIAEPERLSPPRLSQVASRRPQARG